MSKFISLFGRLIREDDGATAIEYGLIAGLIAVVLIVTLQATGTSLTGLFTSVNAGLDGAAGGGGGGGG